IVTSSVRIGAPPGTRDAGGSSPASYKRLSPRPMTSSAPLTMTSLNSGFQHGGSSLPAAPWQIRRAPGIGGTLLETEKGVGLMLAAGQVAATLAVSDVDRAPEVLHGDPRFHRVDAPRIPKRGY